MFPVYCFCVGPPSCGGPGQLPSLPSLKSGPERHIVLITCILLCRPIHTKLVAVHRTCARISHKQNNISRLLFRGFCTPDNCHKDLSQTLSWRKKYKTSVNIIRSYHSTATPIPSQPIVLFTQYCKNSRCYKSRKCGNTKKKYGVQ